MTKEESFSITNNTHSKIPAVPFDKIKKVILGEKYLLSLVFIGETKSLKLNFSYRGKKRPTNILSFPLGNTSGEIFITLSLAKRESVKFLRKPDNFVAFLFIHGLLHLKGMRHGSTMERLEAKFLKQFGV